MARTRGKGTRGRLRDHNRSRQGSKRRDLQVRTKSRTKTQEDRSDSSEGSVGSPKGTPDVPEYCIVNNKSNEKADDSNIPLNTFQS